MENKLTSALATLSAVLGMAACASNRPQPASPTNAQAAPTTESFSSNGASGPAGNVSGAGATGASATEPTPTGASATEPTPTGASATGGTSGAQYGATNTMAGPPEASGLNDAQIAAVVESINRGEIEQGRLAETRAYSPAVRSFAQHMVSAHSAMLDRDESVLSQAHIAASDNAVSNQLKSDAHDQLSALQSTHGREFDRQYIDDQVQGHEDALKLLDELTPRVKSADLKADLETARSKVEDHLRMAESVQRQLQQ